MRKDDLGTQGKKAAKRDIEKGIIKLLIFGPKKYSNKFVPFYSDYLKKEYNILLEIWGCEYTLKDECYNNTMVEYITQKYGPDFLERVESEALAEYEKMQET